MKMKRYDYIMGGPVHLSSEEILARKIATAMTRTVAEWTARAVAAEKRAGEVTGRKAASRRAGLLGQAQAAYDMASLREAQS